LAERSPAVHQDRCTILAVTFSPLSLSLFAKTLLLSSRFLHIPSLPFSFLFGNVKEIAVSSSSNASILQTMPFNPKHKFQSNVCMWKVHSLTDLQAQNSAKLDSAQVKNYNLCKTTSKNRGQDQNFKLWKIS
jgi:hypothetical protein